MGAPLYLATIRANLKWRFIIAWMIERRVASEVVALLDQVPAVALLGPRQAGKTTLALEIAAGRPSVYLDLESATDRARLTEPELYFADQPALGAAFTSAEGKATAADYQQIAPPGSRMFVETLDD